MIVILLRAHGINWRQQRSRVLTSARAVSLQCMEDNARVLRAQLLQWRRQEAELIDCKDVLARRYLGWQHQHANDDGLMCSSVNESRSSPLAWHRPSETVQNTWRLLGEGDPSVIGWILSSPRRASILLDLVLHGYSHLLLHAEVAEFCAHNAVFVRRFLAVLQRTDNDDDSLLWRFIRELSQRAVADNFRADAIPPLQHDEILSDFVRFLERLSAEKRFRGATLETRVLGAIGRANDAKHRRDFAVFVAAIFGIDARFLLSIFHKHRKKGDVDKGVCAAVVATVAAESASKRHLITHVCLSADAFFRIARAAAFFALCLFDVELDATVPRAFAKFGETEAPAFVDVCWPRKPLLGVVVPAAFLDSTLRMENDAVTLMHLDAPSPHVRTLEQVIDQVLEARSRETPNDDHYRFADEVACDLIRLLSQSTIDVDLRTVFSSEERQHLVSLLEYVDSELAHSLLRRVRWLLRQTPRVADVVFARCEECVRAVRKRMRQHSRQAARILADLTLARDRVQQDTEAMSSDQERCAAALVHIVFREAIDVRIRFEWQDGKAMFFATTIDEIYDEFQRLDLTLPRVVGVRVGVWREVLRHLRRFVMRAVRKEFGVSLSNEAVSACIDTHVGARVLPFVRLPGGVTGGVFIDRTDRLVARAVTATTLGETLDAAGAVLRHLASRCAAWVPGEERKQHMASDDALPLLVRHLRRCASSHQLSHSLWHVNAALCWRDGYLQSTEARDTVTDTDTDIVAADTDGADTDGNKAIAGDRTDTTTSSRVQYFERVVLHKVHAVCDHRHLECREAPHHRHIYGVESSDLSAQDDTYTVGGMHAFVLTLWRHALTVALSY